jgi:hypothetical protein
MREVYNAASQIERTIGRARLSYQTQNLWNAIRSDLQQISRGYNNNNNGRGRNNGGWNNGSRNGLPSWWPF